MWDTSIVYSDGRYFLFSMYDATDFELEDSHGLFSRDTHVWCAVSDDGVRWRDVGPVIRDQPSIVMKMFVRKLGDRFVMNYGSSRAPIGTAEWDNDTLRLWESDDLLDWRPLGEERDLHPDPRWYRPGGRWDHMYMLPDDVSGGYLGYCVATPNERYPYASCGLLQSDDGSQWRVLPPPVVEWGDTPELPMFEVGGCEREAGRYYLIGGAALYGGNTGYAVYTLVSDHWNGPFRPDPEAFRLCGTSGYSGAVGAQWLASFARGVDDELLVTNYLTEDMENRYDYGISRRSVWFLPVKKAVIEADGHLRMGYWPANESLKGVPLDPGSARLVYSIDDRGVLTQEAGRVTIDSGAHRSNPLYPRDDHAVAVLDSVLDLEVGVVVEGTLTIDAHGFSRPAKAGFFFEEGGASGTYLLLEAGDPRWRISEIGGIAWEPSLRFEPRDVTSHGAATVTGITNQHEHRFRILCRRSMFELYIDDFLVQSYVTGGPPSGRIGFVVRNGRCLFADLRIWRMDLAGDSE
jgi:hypothetical protein